MGQIVMSQMQFFNQHLSTSFGGNLYKVLERTIWVKPYCPREKLLINVWTPRNEAKWKFVLYPWKDIYKILERTIWVKVYCLMVRICSKYWKNTTTSHICFLKKLVNFFSMGPPVLSLIQIFQKMLEREIKHELLMEINKESLRKQYGSDCNIFWRLMKVF